MVSTYYTSKQTLCEDTQYMSALENFNATITRAKELVKAQRVLVPRGKPNKACGDIFRAVVVISVGGLDEYIHEKVCENVPRLVRSRKGKQLPGKLVEVIKGGADHNQINRNTVQR